MRKNLKIQACLSNYIFKMVKNAKNTHFCVLIVKQVTKSANPTEFSKKIYFMAARSSTYLADEVYLLYEKDINAH